MTARVGGLFVTMMVSAILAAPELQRAIYEAANPGKWRAEHYADGFFQGESETGGIMEAFAACVEGGGGTVEFRQVEIDAAGRRTPLIETPRVEVGNKVTAPCALVGYGQNGGLNYVNAGHEKNAPLVALGSTILVHNLGEALPDPFGEKAVLAARAERQRLEDFSLRAGGLDDDSRGIIAQVPDGNDTLAELSIVRVSVAGDVTIGPSPRGSIGIDFQGAMRSYMQQGTVRNFGTGIELGNTPNDDALKNNSNTFVNVSLRDNYVGLGLKTHHACSETLFLDAIIEGNEIGLEIGKDAQCRPTFVGGHFEQTAPQAIANVVNRSAGTRPLFLGTRFGGTPSHVQDDRGLWQPTDSSWDYVRESAAHPHIGPDLFIGTDTANGIMSRSWVQLISPFAVTRARGTRHRFVGAGDVLAHQNGCERHLYLSHGSTFGRECKQGNDRSTWRAIPIDGMGAEGVADTPEEVVCIANCEGRDG